MQAQPPQCSTCMQQMTRGFTRKKASILWMPCRHLSGMKRNEGKIRYSPGYRHGIFQPVQGIIIWHTQAPAAQMAGQLAAVVTERSWRFTTVENNFPRYADLKAHCHAQGSIIWRARVPAAEMAGQLAAGVMERNWVGAGRIANLHTCVNAETKEGAWVGLANKVRQFPGPQHTMTVSNWNLLACFRASPPAG